MHKNRFTANPAVLTVVAVAVGGLLLMGCGSSSKKTSTKTNSTAGSTATTSTGSSGSTKSSSSQPPALVTAKKDKKLGTVLADDKGLTLYTLTNNGKPVACTGPCLAAWPPLVAPAGTATPNGAAGIKGLSVVMAPGGMRLVAVDGLPLYRFVKDKDAGDAYGDGLKSFGGVWHVSKTTATPSTSATGDEEGPTTTTPTTSSNGY